MVLGTRPAVAGSATATAAPPALTRAVSIPATRMSLDRRFMATPRCLCRGNCAAHARRRASSILLILGAAAPRRIGISTDASAAAWGDTDPVRPTALIVDDHPTFRRMAHRLLGAAGYQVVGEAGDALAVAAVRRMRPQFVLLDVLLPDGDGIDVADQIGGPGGPSWCSLRVARRPNSARRCAAAASSPSRT